MKHSFLFLILWVFCFQICEAQENHSYLILEAQLKQEIRNRKIPSAVVAVSKNGTIVYEKAFGLSDIKRNKKATVNTPYAIASVTKVVTATAIMILQQRKKLSIDDPILKYLGDASVAYQFRESATITIKQLLNHTSGLGTYFNIQYADEKRKTASFTKEFETYGRLFQPAGRVFEYSNIGYELLGQIIETVSGQSYKDFVTAEIFKPLGMKKAFVIEHMDTDVLAFAKRYDAHNTMLPKIATNTPAAGNVIMSIHDLIRLGNFHTDYKNNATILSAVEKTAMQTNSAVNAFYPYYQNTFYGLGWYFQPNNLGSTTVWHEGGMMGTSAILKLIPDKNIAVAVILNNSDRNFCTKTADDLIKIVLPTYVPQPLNESTEIANFKTFTEDASFIGNWEGTLEVNNKEIPITLRLKSDGVATVTYIDETLRSYFTKGNPLPHSVNLNASITNENCFIGLFSGKLPDPNLRQEYTHLLSLKLYKSGNLLSGFLTALPAADREYYAYSYELKLTKDQ